MKKLVFALFLLLSFGAQPALACAEGEAGAHPGRAVASEGARIAAGFDRIADGQRCDCPPQAELARAAVSGPEKFGLITFFGSIAASPEAPLAGLTRALDARSRKLSGSSPGSTLPPYLLTTRLRI